MSAVPCSKNQSRIQLQRRDVALLSELFGHALLSRDQIIDLGFFGSIQRANARLGKLRSKGLIKRYEDQLLASQGLYVATAAAAPIIAESLASDIGLVRQLLRHEVSSLALRHALQATETRIVFEREGSIEKWLPERRCRHEYRVRVPGGGFQRRVFKPDAFFRLHRSNDVRDYFVEIDLGHASQGKIKQKLRSYRDYRREAFQETYGSAAFKVLFVTIGLNRLNNLREFTKSQGGSDCRFTTFCSLTNTPAASAIWLGVEEEKPQSLFEGRP